MTQVKPLRDAQKWDHLTTDPMALLTDFAEWTDRSGGARIKLSGDIPQDSSLGYLIRMEWVSHTEVCAPPCWPFHCPRPENHTREFRLSSTGLKAARRLGVVYHNTEVY